MADVKHLQATVGQAGQQGLQLFKLSYSLDTSKVPHMSTFFQALDIAPHDLHLNSYSLQKNTKFVYRVEQKVTTNLKLGQNRKSRSTEEADL